LEPQLLTDICISRDILGALDRLSLTHREGRYSAVEGKISERDTRKIAQIFFGALGGVGASRFSIRLVHNGKDLHPAEFLSARIGDGLIDHVKVKDRVLHHYLNIGATVVFDHVNDHIPFAQLIQEHVEAISGARCWVQCYITRAASSAFNLHRDDHAFAIVQIFGSKEWRHSAETTEAPESALYSPGTVAFYPKGTPHDVHGIGVLSMHLTIAFEGYGGRRFDELPLEESDLVDLRRRGTGLPYSLNSELITESTPARLALRHLCEISSEANVVQVWTGTSKVAIPTRYAPALRHLALTPSTTVSELSAVLNLTIDDVLKFYRFAFEQGLILSPVQ
jgi:hypothetical protein